MKSAIRQSLRSNGLMLALAFGILFAGCGEKIDIPVAVGDFGIVQYDEDRLFEAGVEVRQITFTPFGLFILGAEQVLKTNIDFEDVVETPAELSDARALCFDSHLSMVFVWDEESKRVSWYDADELYQVGSMDLPEITTVVAMATNNAGIEQVEFADTYLYFSDPMQGVIHRYSFSRFGGLVDHGILCRSNGDSARFVHVPAGMVTDIENRLLVCDQDNERNWVIRFDSTPDVTDVTPNPDDEDQMRGLVEVFAPSECVEPETGDFVLGFAPECDGPAWEGRVGDAPGEFHTPTSIVADGAGNLYIADTGNHRIQITDRYGVYIREFGTEETTPSPASIGVIDQLGAGGSINRGAYVYLHLQGSNRIVRYISSEYAKYLESTVPVDIP